MSVARTAGDAEPDTVPLTQQIYTQHCMLVYYSPAGRHAVPNTQKTLHLLPRELVLSVKTGRLELNFS